MGKWIPGCPWEMQKGKDNYKRKKSIEVKRSNSSLAMASPLYAPKYEIFIFRSIFPMLD